MHLGLAAVVAVLLPLVAAGGAADWAIGASYLAYGLLILHLWRAGPNALTRAPLGQVRRLRLGMAIAAGCLTRSNFYRAFQRAYGQSPAAYRQAAAEGRGGAGA